MVKMFQHKEPTEAEKALALWLEQNDVTIQHLAQSQSERGGNFIFVLTIIYQNN